MTPDIIIVLLILGVALVLFVTEWLRMDVTALLVLSALAITGLVPDDQVLLGFSSPGVVTIWAMFILSAGLVEGGVAHSIGRAFVKWSHLGPMFMTLLVMTVSGLLSAFLNNIAVAALMLPVVKTVARRTERPSSDLLLPMAFGCVMGGMTTVIGTPSNIVAADFVFSSGYEPFALFDFGPVGLLILIGGILFVTLAGHWLLPKRKVTSTQLNLQWQYGLENRRFELVVKKGSPVIGKTIADTGFGEVLDLNIFAVTRNGKSQMLFESDFVLREGDILEIQGEVADFQELLHWNASSLKEGKMMADLLVERHIGMAEVTLDATSDMIGIRVGKMGFRHRYGASIVGVKQCDKRIMKEWHRHVLAEGDTLFVEADEASIGKLEGCDGIDTVNVLSGETMQAMLSDHDCLVELTLSEDDGTDGKNLLQSRVIEGFHLTVVGLVRDDQQIVNPGSDIVLAGGDRLLLQGQTESLDQLKLLQGFEVVDDHAFSHMGEEVSSAMLTEVTLAPRSVLNGCSLVDLNFHRRFGLQVIGIWRAGQPYHSYLRSMNLQFGDALLLSGSARRIKALSSERDFIVLDQDDLPPPTARSRRRMALSIGIMAAVILPVLFGLLKIHVATVCGAALMVATGCLTMSEAYRAIEWKSVFLVAGMIPLGFALESSGAAELLGGSLGHLLLPFGSMALVIGLYIVTALLTFIIPSTALVVLMCPIAIEAIAKTDLSPRSVIMVIAVAASACFMAPVSHPVNVLVMGPGGYRGIDYVKLGVPLVLLAFLLAIPGFKWFWGV